jgi:hypothetical protein
MTAKRPGDNSQSTVNPHILTSHVLNLASDRSDSAVAAKRINDLAPLRSPPLPHPAPSATKKSGAQQASSIIIQQKKKMTRLKKRLPPHTKEKKNTPNPQPLTGSRYLAEAERG